MSYQYPKTTELIERDDEIARLERENGQLREALFKIIDTTILFDPMPGYKRIAAYLNEFDIANPGMLKRALASPAPAYVQEMEGKP